MIAAVRSDLAVRRWQEIQAQTEIDERDSLGLDPTLPCLDPPGSNGKVLAMMRRYSVGLDLFQRHDCDTHGPERIAVPIGTLQHVTRPLDLESLQCEFDGDDGDD